MTSSNNAQITIAANTDELPRPDASSNGIASNASATSGLKRPVSDVTDSGRIKFGAGFRLPLSK